MMNLFSSFNPISSTKTSMNWVILLMIPSLLISTYWKTPSISMMIMKKIFINSSTQLKPSLNEINKINLPIISSIMLTIMMMNLLGLVPYIFSSTSQLMINLSLSVIMWMAANLKKMKNLKKLASNLTPSNTPFILMPFMVMIELVSLMIQPLTLAIRLTANVTAGHIMIILISQMYNLSFLPALTTNLMMLTLELMVSLIQAYVFSMLISMYSK